MVHMYLGCLCYICINSYKVSVVLSAPSPPSCTRIPKRPRPCQQHCQAGTPSATTAAAAAVAGASLPVWSCNNYVEHIAGLTPHCNSLPIIHSTECEEGTQRFAEKATGPAAIPQTTALRCLEQEAYVWSKGWALKASAKQQETPSCPLLPLQSS